MGTDVDAQLAFGMPVCHSTQGEIENLHPSIPEEAFDWEGTSEVLVIRDGHDKAIMWYLVVRKSVIKRSAGYRKGILTVDERICVGTVGQHHWAQIIERACKQFEIQNDPLDYKYKCGWYLLANCS